MGVKWMTSELSISENFAAISQTNVIEINYTEAGATQVPAC